MATERDVDSVIKDRVVGRDLQQQRIDDDFNVAMNNLSLGRDRLAETTRSALADESLRSRGLDQDQMFLSYIWQPFSRSYVFEETPFAARLKRSTDHLCNHHVTPSFDTFHGLSQEIETR